MKKILDWFKIWVGIFISLTVLIFIGLYLTKAWNWLQSSPWDKLTSATWNNLVAKSSVNYQKVSLTNWDYQTTASAAIVPWADITITTSNNPVMIMTSIPASNNVWPGASTLYCDFAIDWTKVAWGSPLFRGSLVYGFTQTLSYNYITSPLTAWSHNFKLYCRSDSSYMVINKRVNLQTQFSVMEFKQ